ncbi:N-acetylgalactosamine-N, N'-diacetylbacillosaminyl-diphospho-undecaprenol4-alpha-N-acetylgalactosaminyltransferase [bacterium HR40]|nr:N-acetylgalactosamine-N, N'-diacetylbacillosaminyl-diphospho-undecaprenol4-alpha-N-acetylgalactosaminyltransferase [bacterium HR40]
MALGVRAAAWPWIARRRGLWVPLALPALVGYLERERPDVLLASSLPANLTAIAAVACSRHRPGVVLTLNLHTSARLAALGLPGRLLGPLVRSAWRRADALVAISAGVAEDARSFLAPRVPPLYTVFNPIDGAAVRARAAAEPAVPLPERRPLVVACGKLEAQKDFPTLLRAFADLRRVMPASLVILGEGSQRRRLERLAAELGLAEDVRFAGWLDNPFAVMARADLFVHASRFEGLSNVLLEALALGLPIVATDCPSGPRELLDHGRFGLLVPPRDAQALAEGMRTVLLHPPDRQALRRRAEEFTVERAAAGYLAAIVRAAGRRGATNRAVLLGRRGVPSG